MPSACGLRHSTTLRLALLFTNIWRSVEANRQRARRNPLPPNQSLQGAERPASKLNLAVDYEQGIHSALAASIDPPSTGLSTNRVGSRRSFLGNHRARAIACGYPDLQFRARQSHRVYPRECTNSLLLVGGAMVHIRLPWSATPGDSSCRDSCHRNSVRRCTSGVAPPCSAHFLLGLSCHCMEVPLRRQCNLWRRASRIHSNAKSITGPQPAIAAGNRLGDR